MFLVLRKTLEHSTMVRVLKLFCLLETTVIVLRNNNEYAESLFIALADLGPSVQCEHIIAPRSLLIETILSLCMTGSNSAD